jgi:TonB family protein
MIDSNRHAAGCRAGIGAAGAPSDTAPNLCAVREEGPVFVLGSSAYLRTDPAFDPSLYTDSCLVELTLPPAGFARGRWACNRRTNRLLVPVGPSTKQWLLRKDGFVLDRAESLGIAAGYRFDARDLWLQLYRRMPDDVLSYVDNGTFDDESMPEIVRRVDARYPDDAHHVTDPVLVKVLVDVDGKVAVAFVDEPTPELDQAAIDAIREWSFRPGRDGTRAVPMWVVVPVKFSAP